MLLAALRVYELPLMLYSLMHSVLESDSGETAATIAQQSQLQTVRMLIN